MARHKGLPGPGVLTRKVKESAGHVENEGVQVLEEMMIEGADLMRDIIETSGTGSQWTHEYPNPPWAHGHNGRTGSIGGRVASGDMVNALDAKVSRSSKGAKGTFGWTDWREDYFVMQDRGFTHKEAHRKIKGMFALQDARSMITKLLSRELQRVVKGKR